MNTLYYSNSSQPYLFSIEDQKYMLYCHADYPINLKYGTSSYTIRPWKIKLCNLETNNSTVVSTVQSFGDYGKIVLECNPHISIIDNSIKIYYTAGFMKTEDSPIVYYLCSMTADNLLLENLRDFNIVQKTFSGTMINSNELLFVDKIYNKDTLVKKNIVLNNSSLVSISNMPFEEILRVTKNFDNTVIITVKTPEYSYASYLLNNNLTNIDYRIHNEYNMDVYKSSILDNILAYTVRYENEDVESRGIVIETMKN